MIKKIAILGDPHFHKSEPNDKARISHNSINNPQDTPWAHLKEINFDNDIDLLICVGDITTRANQEALKYGWAEICNFAIKIRASLVISTAGNHDVNSRSHKEFIDANPVTNMDKSLGAFEALKQLEPQFPIVSIERGEFIQHELLSTQYWGNGFSYHETEHFRIITINSCIEHSPDADTSEKGKIPLSSRMTLEKRLSRIENSSIEKFNIIVCHHPPSSDSTNDLGCHDFIEFGDQLINMLENFNDSWLIIHGHKHHSSVHYARGGSSSPVVFSAGSIGSYNEPLKDGMLNQFYILNLEMQNNSVLGRIEAWNWASGSKWKLAQPIQGGIYNGSGFGNRKPPLEIAAKIAHLYEEHNAINLSWAEISNDIPDLVHITSHDMKRVINRLKNKHNLHVRLDSNGHWENIVENKI